MMRTLIFLSVVASVVLQAHFTAIPTEKECPKDSADCGPSPPPDTPRCPKDHDDSCETPRCPKDHDDSCEHDHNKPCSHPHTDGCHPSEHDKKNKRRSCNVIECYQLSLNLSGCLPQHNYQQSRHPDHSNSCEIDHFLQYFESCLEHKKYQQRDHDKPCSHPHSNGSPHSGNDNRKNCRSDEVNNCFVLCQGLTESNQHHHGKPCTVSDFLKCFSLCVNLTECSKNCQRNDNKPKKDDHGKDNDDKHDRPPQGHKCDEHKKCNNGHYMNCTERCLKEIEIKCHKNCDHHDNSCPRRRLTECIDRCINTTDCAKHPHHDQDKPDKHRHHDTDCDCPKHDERKKCLKRNFFHCIFSCLSLSGYNAQHTYDHHDTSKSCPRTNFLGCYYDCLNRACDDQDICKDDDDSETCRHRH